jgi:hypothetical protein
MMRLRREEEVMGKIRVRVHKGRVVEPAELPEEAEGWLTVPTDASASGSLEAASSDNIWARYDPEKVKATLDKMAGTLTPEEAERRIAEIHRAREEGTRPSTRP